MDNIFFGQLNTIRDLIEIATVFAVFGRDELLPTILELLLVEAQDIVDSYCVVKEE